MKILGTCYPNDMWYKQDNDNLSAAVVWLGQGIWSTLDLMTLMHDPDLEVITELSVSGSPKTHPILQTVLEGQVDFAPLEVGMTSQRFQILDFSHALTFAELLIISRREASHRVTGDFITEIFDVPTDICIGLSFILMTAIIWWSNHLATDDKCQKYSFASILVHSFGAALTQGFLPRMRLGNQGTTLAVLFCFAFMILTTVFSGLVIVKLMAKVKPKSIDTLDDLRRSSVRMIIKPNSYVDDLFQISPEKADLISRIDYTDISVSNQSSLEVAGRLILDGTHVLIDDRSNFMRYLRAMPALMKMEDFHLSTPIDYTPGGWILPKQMDKVRKEQIILNLQRLVDYGIYQVNLRSLSNRLFKHIGNHTEITNGAAVKDKCSGKPLDRRDLLAFRLRPMASSHNYGGHPKLSIEHLRLVFFILPIGYGLSLIAFLMELSFAKFVKN